MQPLEANGITINVQQWGDAEAPAVVLLHDHAEDLRAWMGCIPSLAAEYRVIAPDLRGHGLTTAPEDPADYAIETFAEDLRALLDALQVDLCALVGTGLGGIVAANFATLHPDHVAALALSDTALAHDDPAYDDATRAAIAARAEAHAQVERIGSTGLGRRRALTVRDDFLASAIRRRYAALKTDGYLGAAHAIATRPNLLPTIGERLTMPVLIVTGEHDEARGATLELANRLPAARVVTFRGNGYGVPTHDPEGFVSTLLQFFADVEQHKPVAGRRTI